MKRPTMSLFDERWQANRPTLCRRVEILFEDRRASEGCSPAAMLAKIVLPIQEKWAKEATPNLTDQWLLHSATRELLGQGWCRYDRELRGMISILVWSADVVDELIQGAATRSLERLPELVKKPRPLFGWLCTLVRQQRVDWLRRGGARVMGSLPDDFGQPPAPHTTLTQAERFARVLSMRRRVYEALEPTHRQILELTTLHDQSPSEIADVLGISNELARQRLARARCAAAQEWCRQFPEDIEWLLACNFKVADAQLVANTNDRGGHPVAANALRTTHES